MISQGHHLKNIELEVDLKEHNVKSTELNAIEVPKTLHSLLVEQRLLFCSHINMLDWKGNTSDSIFMYEKLILIINS